jgi:Arc/MetJ-type ribon-helix-helix transcriptional regulator
MNVTLKPEVAQFAEEDIKSGRAVDLDDFLNKAVSHYVAARGIAETYTPEELDALIAEGLESIANGKAIDGDEAFRRIREHRAAHRRRNT